MVGAIATATEMQNNFGKYLNIVMNGGEVVVTRNGKAVGRFIPESGAVSFLTDSLKGVIKNTPGMEEARKEALDEKYEIVDRH